MEKDEIPVGKAEDLRGQKIGRLTVLYRVPNKNNRTMWRCKCDCGTIKDIGASNLKRKTTLSCGCLRKEKISNIGKKWGPVLGSKKLEDLTGQKFGKLTVLYRDDSKPKGHQCPTYWICRCECGNLTSVLSSNLKRGFSTSCGCYRKEWAKTRKWAKEFGKKYGGHNFKDLTGQRFGKLIVLKRGPNKGKKVQWVCICDCGKETLVMGDHLRDGHTQSCGCTKSWGEEKIAFILKENNILFETQKTFKNFKFSKTNGIPRFDFYINKKFLLEFDGEQHFSYSGNDWNTEENFKQTQERDKEKNQWCKNNNIPLIRIPYTKINSLCLEDLLLETTEFRVV